MSRRCGRNEIVEGTILIAKENIPSYTKYSIYSSIIVSAIVNDKYSLKFITQEGNEEEISNFSYQSIKTCFDISSGKK